MAKKNPTRRPRATAITPDMPMHEKLARIRRRVRSDGTFNHQHPHVQRPRKYQQVHSWKKKARFADKSVPNVDSYARKNFTSAEIEAMYLALWDFMQYFGGNKALLHRETGISRNTINCWLEKGRLGSLAAHIIGLNPHIPFSREQLRPDITVKGWQEFDKVADRLMKRRENQRKALNDYWDNKRRD